MVSSGARFLSLGRLVSRAVPLLLAAVLAISSSAPALAQAPELSLVNADREFVERKDDGRFIARPLFSLEVELLFYGVRDADTGDWITPVFRVQGGEKELADGWEYSWEYPFMGDQPDLDPEKAYLLALLLPDPDEGEHRSFHAIIPVHEPSSIWDKVLAALDPGRWARSLAGWVIEGVHGTLCGVVERALDTELDVCRGGTG